MLIIDELIKQRDEKIKEHGKRFPDEVTTLEMFTKKYQGDYYPDYSISSTQPFVNQIYISKEGAWDRFHYDVRELPKFDDPIYIETENFPDYDYLNSVAYEMLIRTVEHKELVNNISEYSDDERIKKCDQLGLDIKDVFDLKKVSKYYGLSKENDTFSNSYFKMGINDIVHGMDRLMQFYIDKKQIHVINSVDKIVLNKDDEKNRKEIITGRSFKIESNITLKKIKASLSDYYIPAKFDYLTPQHNDKLAVIDNNIPLVAFEHDFLLSIEELIPNRIKGNIDFNFTRPLLRFKEMPIVDVPINLNLSRKELTQLVMKLKDDFEEGSVKNPINLLYDRRYHFEELKNITPFKMTKESMVEAFFVYDLYQGVHGAMMLHKQKLGILKQMDIEDVEKEAEEKREQNENRASKAIDSLKNKESRKKYIKETRRDFRVQNRSLEKEKKRELKRINRLYKELSKNYHTMTVLEDLVDNHGSYISPYMCKQYLKFMRKYVEELQYKELIIGHKI